MAKKHSLYPKHPERICWGCDQYCAADDLRCGNGSDRTQHPIEIFGTDWVELAFDASQHIAPQLPEETPPDVKSAR